jgi:hypothetical protein
VEGGALADLPLPASVDAVIEYEYAEYDQTGTPIAKVVIGTPCATATDHAKCMSTLAALVAPTAPPSNSACGGGCALHSFLVTTASDVVKKLEHGSDVVTLFGPVTSTAEAALVEQLDSAAHLTCKDFTAQGSDFAYQYCGDNLVHPDGSSSYVGGPKCAGRLPEGGRVPMHGASVGSWLAAMADLEAQAVDAFARMVVELRHHGAPSDLVDRATEAQADEIRHARTMADHAVRFGGARDGRGRARGPMHPRERVAMARENAIEGCVRETFGAIVAAYQAHAATDEALRVDLMRIAEDEARHAQLSWDLAAWIEPQLDPAARRSVEQARRAALEALRDGCGLDADAQAEVPGLQAIVGLPSRREAEAMCEVTCRLLQAEVHEPSSVARCMAPAA